MFQKTDQRIKGTRKEETKEIIEHRKFSSIMNTLQRSSCSFRRQGSSGRIWTDHMFIDPKANGTATSSNGVNKYKEENNVSQNIEVRGLHDDEVAPHSRPLSSPSSTKTENKVHRGFFSLIFGRCMSSPPIHD